MIRMIKVLAASIALVCFTGVVSPSAKAAEDMSAGLFVNLTTLDAGMAGHALAFAGKAMKRGHPVAVFLNHNAVLIAAEGVPMASYGGKPLNEHLADLIAGGATVIVCQMCMKGHGMTEANLVDGAVGGKPELVQGLLFDPKYKVMSW